MDLSQISESQDVHKWLRENIVGNPHEFTGPNASDLATALVAQQDSRWKQLFNRFDGFSGTLWTSTVGPIKEAIANAPPAQIVRNGPAYVVERSVPLILKNIDRSIASQLAQSQRLAFFYLLQISQDVINFEQQPVLFSLLLSISAADYRWSGKASSDFEADGILQKTFAAKCDDAQKQIDYLKERATHGDQEIAQKIKTAEDLLSKLDVDNVARREAWQKEKLEIVEGLKREALEFTKIQVSVNLWRNKSRLHLSAFAIAALIFAGTLIETPFFIAYHGIPFIKELAKTFPGDKEYIGIALLVIPTLAVAWLLRFVAKIALQNLSLSQDAQQRNAQIVTYLRLLGDPTQPISKNERVLALSAIFRPLAGQGADDISPPTIADLFREAIEKGIKLDK